MLIIAMISKRQIIIITHSHGLLSLWTIMTSDENEQLHIKMLTHLWKYIAVILHKIRNLPF